jgi:biotin transport system substrate-specific component
MRGTAPLQPTLLNILWPTRRQGNVLRGVVLVFVGSALLTLSAKIQVPFWPVPMTMQTFVVLVLGMTLGPRLAAAAVIFYLIQGAAGLPVFAGTPLKGIGLVYMAGPTGGYLAGFLGAAVMVGALAERGWDRHWASALAALLIGTMVIFALGLVWLSGLTGIETAIAVGFLPFLPGEALKIALAAAFLPLCWRALGAGRR